MSLIIFSSCSMKAAIWDGSVSFILASVSRLLTSIGNFRRAILASSTFLGIEGSSLPLSITTPLTICDSSTVAPCILLMFMWSLSTTPSSSTISTALTIRSASGFRAFSVPFPVIAVIAILWSVSVSDALIDMPSRISCALAAAFLYPAEMTVG